MLPTKSQAFFPADVDWAEIELVNCGRIRKTFTSFGHLAAEKKKTVKWTLRQIRRR